jgi:creatinine amidohydrolase
MMSGRTLDRYSRVQYELLRPSQVKELREQYPIVYIPVGSLEWHGVHNPLGTDGLKAHAICCEAALRYGGVVLPTLFLGILGEDRGWGPEGWGGYTITCHDGVSLEDTIYRTARGLIADEYKVLVGVTGHDVERQRDAIHNGIQRACAGTDARGFGVCEGENWHGGTSMHYSMDHAGAWETSVMQYAYGECVSLDELRKQMTTSGRIVADQLRMKEPEGIGGWNPLHFASADLGERIIAFCAERIGRKAQAVLDGSFIPPAAATGDFMDNPGPTD